VLDVFLCCRCCSRCVVENSVLQVRANILCAAHGSFICFYVHAVRYCLFNITVVLTKIQQPGQVVVWRIIGSVGSVEFKASVVKFFKCYIKRNVGSSIVCLLLLTSELTSDTVRCCSSCFNRVIRMINSVQSGSSIEASDGTLCVIYIVNHKKPWHFIFDYNFG